jgi:hypothetical protein
MYTGGSSLSYGIDHPHRCEELRPSVAKLDWLESLPPTLCDLGVRNNTAAALEDLHTRARYSQCAHLCDVRPRNIMFEIPGPRNLSGKRGESDLQRTKYGENPSLPNDHYHKVLWKE